MEMTNNFDPNETKPDKEIKPVSCRVASFLDNKTDRIVYEEAVCEINRMRTHPDSNRKNLPELEESVQKLEEAVKEAPPSCRFAAEKEIRQIKDTLDACLFAE